MRIHSPKYYIHKLQTKCRSIRMAYERVYCVNIIESRYGSFWNFKQQIADKMDDHMALLYDWYLDHYGAYVGPKAVVGENLTLPHGLHGIFISNGAVIGNDVTIFQHVTIGSNLLKDTKHCGSPRIGNNVIIGAGAKIIGGITIGDNVRIGAGCVVHKDIPANATVVLDNMRIIQHQEPKNNEFIAYNFENV